MLLSQFAHDVKPNAACDTKAKVWDGIQRNLDKPEKWTHKNPVYLNKSKCKVLHMDQGNPRYEYRVGSELIESIPTEDLWVLMAENLNMR